MSTNFLRSWQSSSSPSHRYCPDSLYLLTFRFLVLIIIDIFSLLLLKGETTAYKSSMKLTKAVPPWLRLVASRGRIARSQNVSKTRPFSCLVPTTPHVQTSLGIRTAYQLTAKMSLCRQNYPEECEAGVNRQISLELYASYVYLSMVRQSIGFVRIVLFAFLFFSR